MKDYSVIGAYESYVEASIVKEKLIAVGIYALLVDEHLPSIFPLYSLATGGVKVLVHNNDLKAAKKILEETKAAYKKALICPACGSDQVHFVSSQKNPKNWLVLVISAILSIFPFYNKKVYRCDRCGYEMEFPE